MTTTSDPDRLEYTAQIRRDGFALLPSLLDTSALRVLLELFTAEASRPNPTESHSRRGGSTYALRNVLGLLGSFPESDALMQCVKPILGSAARPVRGILFDKIPRANWAVGWHQDTVIPVKKRIDTPGYAPWSIKAGVPHVQPPVHILESMLTLRIHLDDCDENNGPLEVVPGTHRHRILEPEQVRAAFEAGPILAMTCRARGVLAMRPLLLHSSRPARSPGHRRVLHLEYAGVPLPPPLEWPER